MTRQAPKRSLSSQRIAFVIYGLVLGLAPGVAPRLIQANNISDKEPLSQEQIEELQSLDLPMLG